MLQDRSIKTECKSWPDGTKWPIGLIHVKAMRRLATGVCQHQQPPVAKRAKMKGEVMRSYDTRSRAASRGSGLDCRVQVPTALGRASEGLSDNSENLLVTSGVPTVVALTAPEGRSQASKRPTSSWVRFAGGRIGPALVAMPSASCVADRISGPNREGPCSITHAAERRSNRLDPTRCATSLQGGCRQKFVHEARVPIGSSGTGASSRY